MMAEALALKVIGGKKGKNIEEVSKTLHEEGISGRGVIRMGKSGLNQIISLSK